MAEPGDTWTKAKILQDDMKYKEGYILARPDRVMGMDLSKCYRSPKV